MDFCYFERDIDCFSEQEGVHKEINGYLLGEYSSSKIRFKKQLDVVKTEVKDEPDDDDIIKDDPEEDIKVPPPVLYVPEP